MSQPREHRAFAHESLLCRTSDQRRIQQLHGGAAFVATVAAPREPHAAHASLTERRFEGVGAELRFALF
jgi:hypothetical protein